MSDLIKYHVPFYAWMIIIFIQSSFPSSSLPDIELISADKILHILVYGLLMLLCYNSLRKQNKYHLLSSFPLISAVIISIIYGITDEIHQSFVPNRFAELNDLLANITGILIMSVIIKYRQKFAIFRVKVN